MPQRGSCHIISSESEQDDHDSRMAFKVESSEEESSKKTPRKRSKKPGSKAGPSNKKIKTAKSNRKIKNGSSNKKIKNNKSNKEKTKTRKPRITKKHVKENPVVGIDLGTSFSTIAFHDGAYTTIFADAYDSRLISSVVYFDPNNGQAFVGEEAERKSEDCPSNLIIDSKRFMGVMYHNEFVSKYRQMPSNVMEIVEDENGMAAFSVQINGQKVVMKPEEIAAEILRYLIGMTETHFVTQVKRAVISVPASFSNSQRTATKKAAALVGLEVVKLITEPTAGAVCSLKDQMRKSNVMVFDWGGGTLDLSFIKVINNTFEVRAVYGDLFLGGRDVDEKLYGHFRSGMGDINNRSQRQMLNVLRRIKKRLTVHEQVEELSIGGDNGKVRMSRSEFDKILNDIYERIENMIRFSLEESGWSPSKVDHVVMIGGSSRILMIKTIIKDIFGEGKIKTDLNPSEAVAIGAAVQAYELVYRDKDRENFSATDVTPRSLGISIATALFVIIIEKNTSIPVTKSKEFVTVKNDQTSLHFSIYEGERKNCAFNNKLGELEINNLTPKRAGDVKVNIVFNLNEDGILNITASESSCGGTKSLAVTMGHFRFSEQRISYTRLEAERRSIEDKVFENFNIRRNEMNKKIEHVLYALDKISNQADKDKVERICKDFQNFANCLRFTEIEILRDTYQEVTGELSSILRDVNISD